MPTDRVCVAVSDMSFRTGAVLLTDALTGELRWAVAPTVLVGGVLCVALPWGVCADGVVRCELPDGSHLWLREYVPMAAMDPAA